MNTTPEAVTKFINSIADIQKRQDSLRLIELMQQATGEPPAMWGSSMVGFGNHHYKYESGREGDTFVMGFSPRKPAIVLYGLMLYEQGRDLAQKLGKHTEGKGCLYVKRLADIDESVLTQMMTEAFQRKS